MWQYLVVAYNPNNIGKMSRATNYYFTFNNKVEAVNFLESRQSYFKTKELYDCTNGLSQKFRDDWCFINCNDESQAERQGYFWDSNLEEFVKLQRGDA